MSQPYFVRDYRRTVANFTAALPVEEAMAKSVGGGGREAFESIGKQELELLVEFGFRDGHALVDIGCGSGRLSAQISRRFGTAISYLGTDVVPELLAHAKANASSAYKFVLIEECVIPAADNSADFVAAFSVLTHLRRRDIGRYLMEAHRVLRPGGKLMCSYLEPFRHARIFAETIAKIMLRRLKVENHFASERTVKRWAKESDFKVDVMLPRRIGQSVAVLLKP
jgi:ubiquinone/menaquinone biosynthesis C-methylase UbiE